MGRLVSVRECLGVGVCGGFQGLLKSVGNGRFGRSGTLPVRFVMVRVCCVLPSGLRVYSRYPHILFEELRSHHPSDCSYSLLKLESGSCAVGLWCLYLGQHHCER